MHRHAQKLGYKRPVDAHILISLSNDVMILSKGHSKVHTQEWEPVTITLQALSLVEKAKPVQVRFTPTLEGPTEYVNARWMQSLHGIL